MTDGVVSCPDALAGLLEVRGVGIVRVPHRASATLALVIDLGGEAARLPEPERDAELDVPVICLDAFAASAPDKVALALDCALGHVTQIAGAFKP